MRCALSRRASALAAPLCAVLLLGGVVVGATRAAFSATTATPATFEAKQVFPATRSWSAWDLRDSSSGTETDASDAEAFSTVTTTTGRWSNAWTTARYLTYDMNDPLPAAVGVTGATFDFDFADSRNTAADQVCFYFEVLRRSTGTVIGTHGSSASPVACEATRTIQTTSTAIPEVTTSDIANDLRIRVFAMHTTSRAMTVGRVVVNGSTPAAAFTLYETSAVDAADATPATTPWEISDADAAGYQNATNWPTAFNAARYLKVTFPAYLPAAASITSAQLVHTWRSVTAGRNVCSYFEVYSGATLLGTHFSAAAPSCNATTTFGTDTLSLPELDTAAKVNGVTIKLYVRDSVAGRSQDDLFKLDVAYAVD